MCSHALVRKGRRAGMRSPKVREERFLDCARNDSGTKRGQRDESTAAGLPDKKHRDARIAEGRRYERKFKRAGRMPTLQGRIRGKIAARTPGYERRRAESNGAGRRLAVRKVKRDPSTASRPSRKNGTRTKTADFSLPSSLRAGRMTG
jgi:hypothetical protein